MNIIEEITVSIGNEIISNQKYCKKCKIFYDIDNLKKEHNCEWWQLWMKLTQQINKKMIKKL
jgi:hypothetical protein